MTQFHIFCKTYSPNEFLEVNILLLSKFTTGVVQFPPNHFDPCNFRRYNIVIDAV